MPIAKKTLDKIAALLKIPVADIEAANVAEKETELTIDDTLQSFTKVEIEGRDRIKYTEGKVAGEEMLTDNLKKDNGIDIPGKDAKKIIEEIKKKAALEANATPDAQVTELTKQLDTHKKALQKANEKTEQLETEKLTIQGDNKLLALFPKDRADTIADDEYLSLVKSKISIKKDGDKEVVYKDGAPVIDTKTLEPISPKDAIAGYFTDRNWIKKDDAGAAGGGRGGGNSGHGAGMGGFKKLSDVRKSLEDQKINPMGQEGQARLQAAIKENPTIDMNS